MRNLFPTLPSPNTVVVPEELAKEVELIEVKSEFRTVTVSGVADVMAGKATCLL